jgi:hypothetical protein
VYRLLTKNTVERHYFDHASKKLGLSDSVLSDLKEVKDRRKLDEMIREGTIEILREDEETAKKKSNAFMDDDIHKILSTGYENMVNKANSKSMFSEATFDYSDSNCRDLDVHAADFWDKALEHRESKISKLKNNFVGENLKVLESNQEMLRDLLGINIVLSLLLS